MRMNDNFNIITGEVKRQYPATSHGKRFASLEVIKQMKENESHPNRSRIPTPNTSKLGTAKDNKLYQYSYGNQGSKDAQSQPQIGM